jgi:hypothetical protein
MKHVPRKPSAPVFEPPPIVDGVQTVPRADIARLRGAGLSARQIADRLGVNRFLIERALRTMAPLRKCGP